MKLIKRVARERRLVTIAALHDANLALRFADEVALMKNGSIYVIGRPEEVLVPENVREVFGVNATLVKNPRPFMIVEDVVEESHGVRDVSDNSTEMSFGVSGVKLPQEIRDTNFGTKEKALQRAQ
jgi:iron complex transport system ATP-binding protein